MDLELYFTKSKEIIQFCYTFVIVNASDLDNEDLPEPDLEPLPPAASIDIYISYMFIIAIVLGFVYFKKLHLKK